MIGDMSTATERLRHLLADLERLPSDPWSGIETWIARARPLFLHSYPRFVDDFNRLAVEPQRPFGVRVYSIPSRWETEYDRARRLERERSNAEQDPEEDREHHRNLTKAHQNLIAFVQGVLSLAGLPAAELSGAPVKPVAPTTVTNITHSSIGVAAIGPGSSADGHINVGLPTQINREMLKEAVTDLQEALLKVQDQLETIDDRLYGFLSDILVNLRKLQLEQVEMAAVQSMVKECVDDMWAKEAVKEFKPQLLPKITQGMKVVGDIAKNPIAQQLVRSIAGG